MSVTVMELARDEAQNYRFQGVATLGDGTKKVLGISRQRDEAEQIARRKAQRAEHELAAIETHDPDSLVLEPREGQRMLKDPAGTIVEVPENVVEHLLAVGYEVVDPDSIPQRAPEATGVVGLQRRRPGRPRKDAADVPPSADEMDA